VIIMEDIKDMNKKLKF